MDSDKIDCTRFILELPEPVFAISEQGVITQSNRAASERFGYTAEEFLGLNVSELMPEPHASQHSGYVQSYLKTGIAKIIGKGRKVPIKLKDGTIRPAYLTVTEQKIGTKSYFLGLLRDLTEIENSQSEIHSLGEIIKTGNNELHILREESLKFIFANQGALKQLGYTEQEFYQLSPFEINPNFDEASARNLIKSLDQIPIVKFNSTQKRKDGTIYPVQVTIQRGEYLGQSVIIAHCEDKTKEIELQNQIIHSSRLAAIGELAAGVGHEINNPLSIALGYLAGISKNLKSIPQIPDIVIDRLSKTEKALDRIRVIVNGLRTFARSDTIALDLIPVCITVQETIGLIKEIYRQDGIEIDFTLPKTPLLIEGSSGKLQQVVMNLLANARDALLDGKIQNPKIQIIIKDKTPLIEVEVSDNGAGIAEAIRPKIFDAFFTTKAVGKGTGLGLSVSSSLIKSMNGELLLKSTGPTGTKFLIRLPQKKTAIDQSANVTIADLTPDPHRLPIKLLIVDDEKELVHCWSEILSGYLTEPPLNAYDGVEALDWLTKTQIHLLLVDLKMPRLDGFSVLRKIKNMGLKQPPYIVAMSGGIATAFNADERIELRGLVDAYLKKPFNQHEVLPHLDYAYRKYLNTL